MRKPGIRLLCESGAVETVSIPANTTSAVICSMMIKFIHVSYYLTGVVLEPTPP